MAVEFNLFQREESLAAEAAAALSRADSADAMAMLSRLLDGYRCLLHESQQLIRIADRRELELNRLNRKLQALTRSLAFQAEHDALTGTLNKSAIAELLARQLANGTCCLMLLDIDHFKRVNDQYGHLAGDHVLRGVADRIQACISDAETLGRFGGEEFMIISPQSSLRLAQIQAERIRAAIADDGFEIGGGNQLEVTLSVGLTRSEDGEALESLIGRTDAALYVAKRSGRNRVEVAA